MIKYKLISAAFRSFFGRAVDTSVFLVLFAVLSLAVIWGATFHLISVERAAVESAASQSTRELIDTYEAQLVRNFGAIDQTLRIIKYAYERHQEQKNKATGKQFTLRELKDKRLLPSSLVFDIHLTDRRGAILAIAANGATTKAMNVADQPYFQVHLKGDTGSAFVSKASRNQTDGQWRLQFSRRLNASSGAFDGIVVVSVDPAYFTSGYEFSRLGAHGLIGLLGQDGEFRVKRSGDDVSSGQQVDYLALTRGSLKQAIDGAPLTNPWDGVRRYTITRELHSFPLIAIVGLSEEEQLAAYYQHRRSYLRNSVAASTLLIIIILVLGRLNWQLTKSRRRTRKIQETYHAASEASLDAFFVLRSMFDAQGLITDFVLTDTNSRGEALIGAEKADLLGKTLCEVFPKSRTNGFLNDLVRVAQTGVSHEKEWRNAVSESRAEWLYRQVVPVADGVVALVRDISERKRLENKIQYQATHDGLTGLPNRHLLRQHLQSSIASAINSEHPVWVVFVDLDRFKNINDSLGHKVGDLFLKSIADRLQKEMRKTDIVARLGGDEFVVILPGGVNDKLTTATVQRIMETVSTPVLIEGRELSLSCSIGVAVYPNDGVTPEVLIERADIAMYRAKETGRDNFQFFTSAMNEHLLERLRFESDLRSAIVSNEFLLHYQPQVDLRSGKVVGMEALIRWRHPELGMVAPNRFIGVAEETGLIGPIGDWVIRTACAQNMEWQRAGYGPLRVAVNLSAHQFRQPDLVKSIAAVLQENNMEAHHLEIELTETLVMHDVENAIGVLRDLKALGVKLSIDDFGTGYSSLSYLRRFPIDVLKIDQSFVRDIALDSDDAVIVTSIISLAHSLRLDVIAEGVETVEQLAYLRRHGCDEMQGYYFSKPVAAVEFGQLLQQKKCLSLEMDKFGAVVEGS